MQPSFFTGPFAPMCEKFVAQQRAVGKKYETAARQLRQLLVPVYLQISQSQLPRIRHTFSQHMN